MNECYIHRLIIWSTESVNVSYLDQKILCKLLKKYSEWRKLCYVYWDDFVNFRKVCCKYSKFSNSNCRVMQSGRKKRYSKNCLFLVILKEKKRYLNTEFERFENLVKLWQKWNCSQNSSPSLLHYSSMLFHGFLCMPFSSSQ